jgi:hypothetical protein
MSQCTHVSCNREYEPVQLKVVNAVTANISRGRNTQRQRIGTKSTEENKRSASEQLTPCAYNKIQSVVINCEDFKCDYKVVCVLKYSDIQSVTINCKFCLTIYPINRDIKSRTHKLLTRYQTTCHSIFTNQMH